MGHTIKDIAAAIGADAMGDVELRVGMVREPASAGCDDLALVIDPKYAPDLALGRAKAAMVWQGADWQAMGLRAAITAPRPRYAMAGLSALMDPGTGFHTDPQIDKSAEIGIGAQIGQNDSNLSLIHN